MKNRTNRTINAKVLGTFLFKEGPMLVVSTLFLVLFGFHLEQV